MSAFLFRVFETKHATDAVCHTHRQCRRHIRRVELPPVCRPVVRERDAESPFRLRCRTFGGDEATGLATRHLQPLSAQVVFHLHPCGVIDKAI